MSKHWINVNTGYMEIYIYCDESDEANLVVFCFVFSLFVGLYVTPTQL
jgi:hypothetical protein